MTPGNDSFFETAKARVGTRVDLRSENAAGCVPPDGPVTAASMHAAHAASIGSIADPEEVHGLAKSAAALKVRFNLKFAP